MAAGREKTGQQVRVLLVDSSPLVRRGLADVISSEPDIVVCGEAADAVEALHLVDSLHPDVVITDLSLASGNGIELIEQIRERTKRIKTLVISMHDEFIFAGRALRAGAMGYLNKQEPTEKVIDAIREVINGQIYLSAKMANRLLHSVVAPESLVLDPTSSLSSRELEIFELIGQGLTTRKIARRLHLSPKTIETHREKIKAKLNLSDNTELSRRAVEWNLSTNDVSSDADDINQPAIEIYIDPGSASREAIQEVLEALSDLQMAAGGLGLEYRIDDQFVLVAEEVVQ